MTATQIWRAETDLALAARRRLAAEPSLRGVLGPSPPGTVSTTWLFPRELSVVVEGTGLAAAVLSIQSGWARPNAHNTAQFPRLIVEIYADSQRGQGTEVVRWDAPARAWWARRAFRAVLHRPYGFVEVWGADAGAAPPDPGQRVWGSQELVEPDMESLPDWPGGVVLRLEYGLNVG